MNLQWPDFLSTVQAAAWVCDLEGKVVSCNRCAEQMLGRTADEVRAHGVWSCFPAEAAEVLRAEFQRPHADRPWPRVCRLRDSARASGGWEVQVFVVGQSAALADGYLVLARECEACCSASSEGHEASANLPQLAAQVGKLTHDLNNIFTSIHSSLDLALNSGHVPAAIQPLLLQAQTGARRAAQAVNKFRTTTRAAEGKPELTEKPAAEALSPEPRKVPSMESQALEGHECVLIVDDEHSVRLLLRAVLGYRGYQIREAADGYEAVQVVQTNGDGIDLVILDLDMPRMNGLEALRKMRERRPGLRALLLSGGVVEPELMPDSTGDCYLAKPFQNLELVKTVRRILDR